jgi:hypothetical protein
MIWMLVISENSWNEILGDVKSSASANNSAWRSAFRAELKSKWPKTQRQRSPELRRPKT